MEFKLEEQDGQAVLYLDGDLDVKSVRGINPRLDELVQSEFSRLVVDMKSVAFIDSSGVGALVYLYKRLLQRKKSLAIRGLSGQPADMIRFLRIDKVINIVEAS